MYWIQDNLIPFLRYPYVQSLIIVIGAIFLAKLADIFFTRFFRRIVSKTQTGLDDKIIDLLHRPIFYSIIFIGLSIAVKRAELPNYMDYAVVGVFKTITILIWFVIITRIFVLSMEWASNRTESKLLQNKTVPLFNNLGKIVIALVGVYFICLSWNINLNGWLASAGVLGVVLGLAAKDTVANFFAGIFLMADSPFKEGDYILLDTGERGYVRNMGIRSTRIMTRDDIEITIPNSVIASSKIVNESGGPKEMERVRITLQVSYGSDIDKVKKLLKNIAVENSNVIDQPMQLILEK